MLELFFSHHHHQLFSTCFWLRQKNAQESQAAGTEPFSELLFGSSPTQTHKIQTCCLFSCQTRPKLVKERSSRPLNMSCRVKESFDSGVGNKHEQDNSRIFQPSDLIIIYNVGRLGQASAPLVHLNMAERHKEE